MSHPRAKSGSNAPLPIASPAPLGGARPEAGAARPHPGRVRRRYRDVRARRRLARRDGPGGRAHVRPGAQPRALRAALLRDAAALRRRGVRRRDVRGLDPVRDPSRAPASRGAPRAAADAPIEERTRRSRCAPCPGPRASSNSTMLSTDNGNPDFGISASAPGSGRLRQLRAASSRNTTVGMVIAIPTIESAAGAFQSTYASQAIVIRKMPSPTSETAIPLQSTRKSRWRSGASRRARSKPPGRSSAS